MLSAAAPATGSVAAPVDALELYRWAVQDPETHAAVLRIMYERLRPGRSPTVLREDFAGSCADAVAWIALGRGRSAVAVDLDGAALAWASRRAERILGPHAARLDIVEADVTHVAPPRVAPADIISALNFSILYLHSPEALRAYFRHVVRCLAPEGLLVLNLMGGPGSRRPRLDRHQIIPRPRLISEPRIAPFEYQWEHRSYDEAACRLDCRIHFAVPDPTDPTRTHEVRDAFRYDWRLWTPAELTAALRDSGFGMVQTWRHTHDATAGRPARAFLGPVAESSLASLDTWTAYIVAGVARSDRQAPA